LLTGVRADYRVVIWQVSHARCNRYLARGRLQRGFP